jgi:SAM-dependent methyltransferase
VLQSAYKNWYRLMVSYLSSVPGESIEYGSGCGNFKEYHPIALASDLHWEKWLDLCADALHPPIKSNSLANIIMIDVLHHLPNPLVFFRQTAKILKQGGRIILIEPFPSLFSLPVYRKFHPEPFIIDPEYCKRFLDPSLVAETENQAIAYLLFFRQFQEIENYIGLHYSVITKKKIGWLLYPLSGGFSHAAFIPNFMIPLCQVVERCLAPLVHLFAFRCYVVLEKR